MDPELPQPGILLQLPDRRDRAQIGLAHARAGMGLVVESGDALGDPPAQDSVDGLAAGFEIGGDALDRPALAVQTDHGKPTIGGAGGRPLGSTMVGRVAACHREDRRAFREDAFDGVRAGAAIEADLADARDLAEREGRMLRFERDDVATDRLGQGAMLLHLRGAEEARHPFGGEARGATIERPFRRPRLPGTFGGCVIEQDDWANEFVGALLGELDAQLQLLPVIGRLDPLPLAHHEAYSCHPDEKERGRSIAIQHYYVA